MFFKNEQKVQLQLQNECKKIESLSSKFSTKNRIIIALIIIIIMSLYIYSDVSTGAYIQVQIKYSNDIYNNDYSEYN